MAQRASYMEAGSTSGAFRRAARELKKSSSERSEFGTMRLQASRSALKCWKNSRSKRRSIWRRTTGSVNIWGVAIRDYYCGMVQLSFGMVLGVQHSDLAQPVDAD